MFALIGSLVLARLVIQLFEIYGTYEFKGKAKIFINKFTMILLIAIATISLGNKYMNKNQKAEYISKSTYPIQATEWILENLDLQNINLYNEYNYGSYLLYRGIPVFIDSRCDLYLPEFNGLEYNIFLDDMLIYDDYRERFKFYNVSHVLVNKGDILYKIIINDDDYKEIYSDKYFILFERISYEEGKV